MSNIFCVLCPLGCMYAIACCVCVNGSIKSREPSARERPERRARGRRDSINTAFIYTVKSGLLDLAREQCGRVLRRVGTGSDNTSAWAHLSSSHASLFSRPVRLFVPSVSGRIAISSDGAFTYHPPPHDFPRLSKELQRSVHAMLHASAQA